MKNLRNEDWRKSVIYQIYPKSFYSAKNTATGDLAGIIEKLDYLAFLGVDYLWLTPIYPSPQRDNGYDVSDYRAIDPRYGTMEEFKTLLEEARRRKIGIIMDMVFNHTSTDHKWFQEARKSPDNPYRSYYIWRDQPNNWKSKFGGSAWEYDEVAQQYYLHLFDKTQADLNWENEEVRREIYKIMKFWADMGVAGFRLDVINLISKDQRFPDAIGEGPMNDGRKFYTDGPRVHEFLQEMHREVLEGTNLITVGEMSSTTIEHGVKYSRPDRKELNMIFSFHHMKVDYPDGEKWVKGAFDLRKLKKVMSEWQKGMYEGGGWNALFWCNHDQPRIVSRFGNETIYRRESATMLATALHMLQGTPYIYQGEEIGMTNPHFDSIDEYRDVETLNAYRLHPDKEAIMEAIKQKSRDNSRTPMQWNSEKYAGFSTTEPWINVAPNYKEINVENALQDPRSILYHYKELIRLRKTYDIITYGKYELLLEDHPRIWAYTRILEDEALLVVNNFSEEDAEFILPEGLPFAHWNSRVLIANYEDAPNDFRRIPLRPYESVVFHFTR